MLEEGRIVFTGRFTTAALQSSLDYIKGQIGRVGQMRAVESFSVALSIENSLLESRYLETLAGDAAEFLKVRRQLMEDTARHRDAIRTQWDRHRNDPSAV